MPSDPLCFRGQAGDTLGVGRGTRRSRHAVGA